MSKAILKTSQILTETWQAMTWSEFQKLTTQAEYNQARFYYHHSQMKIEMSPLGINHSRNNAVVARLISLFATCKNIKVLEFINVTLRKAEVQECQPDSVFYLEDIPQFPCRSNEPIDLNQYPPPALVIEISSTTMADDLGEKRLLYEQLGIREYWVINTNNSQVTMLKMFEGGSREIEVSQVLPNLQSLVVKEAIERSKIYDDGEVNRWLIRLFSE